MDYPRFIVNSGNEIIMNTLSATKMNYKIREYIRNNPLKWHLDRENPERIAKDVLEEEIFRHSSLKEIVACG